MTATTAELEQDAHLGHDIAERWQRRGFGLGLRPIGSLGASSKRFAASIARPMDVRRALRAHEVQRVHRLGDDPAPPERRWWTNVLHWLAIPRNPLGRTPAPAHAYTRRDVARAATISLADLPPRGLPSVMRRVPNEQTWVPGRIVDSLRPSVVAVRKVSEVGGAGVMLTSAERQMHAASLANPQMYVPPKGSAPKIQRAPQLAAHRNQPPPPKPAPRPSRRESSSVPPPAEDASTAATLATSVSLLDVAASEAAPGVAPKPRWLPRLKKSAARAIGVPRYSVSRPTLPKAPTGAEVRRKLRNAVALPIGYRPRPAAAAAATVAETSPAPTRRAIGKHSVLRPGLDLRRAATQVIAIPSLRSGAESAAAAESQPTDSDEPITPPISRRRAATMPALPTRPAEKQPEAGATAEREPDSAADGEPETTAEVAAPVARPRRHTLGALPLGSGGDVPTAAVRGLRLATGEGEEIRPAITAIGAMSTSRAKSADADFERVSGIRLGDESRKFAPRERAGKAMLFWWPILAKDAPLGRALKPEGGKPRAVTMFGVRWDPLEGAMRKLVGSGSESAGASVPTAFRAAEEIVPATTAARVGEAAVAPPAGAAAASADVAAAAGIGFGSRARAASAPDRPMGASLALPVAPPPGSLRSEPAALARRSSTAANESLLSRTQKSMPGLGNAIAGAEVAAAAWEAVRHRHGGAGMSMPEQPTGPDQVWRRAAPTPAPIDPRMIINDRRWFEELVDRIVDRLELRVVDELERRGRRHGRGAY